MTDSKPTPINPSIKKAQRVLKLGKLLILGILIGVFLSFVMTKEPTDLIKDNSSDPATTLTTEVMTWRGSAPIKDTMFAIIVCAYSISCSAILIASVFLADYYRKDGGKSHE